MGGLEARSGCSLDGSDVEQGCHLLRGHPLSLISPGFCVAYLASLEDPYFEGHVKSFNLASRQWGVTADLQAGQW